MKKKYDLEERLIVFALAMMKLSESLPNSSIGLNLSNQIHRSGASPALNYSEAQAAESRKDFIHKFRLILKELRETKICLELIKRYPLVVNPESIENEILECGALIGIFTKSIQTAKSKMTSK